MDWEDLPINVRLRQCVLWLWLIRSSPMPWSQDAVLYNCPPLTAMWLSGWFSMPLEDLELLWRVLGANWPLGNAEAMLVQVWAHAHNLLGVLNAAEQLHVLACSLSPAPAAPEWLESPSNPWQWPTDNATMQWLRNSRIQVNRAPSSPTSSLPSPIEPEPSQLDPASDAASRSSSPLRCVWEASSDVNSDS